MHQNSYDEKNNIKCGNANRNHFFSLHREKKQRRKVENIQTQKVNDMNNLISTVEISITDFARAVKFYQTVLDISIEEMEMDGNQKKKKGGGGGDYRTTKVR